jgi:hypothetical protein
VISDRFETLCQAFRVFAEQQFRFPRLFLVDAPEAVGNLDHAMDGILHGFHGLYDAARAEAEDAFNFYENPFCAFALRLRNARHHNQANGLRNLYRRARFEEPPVDYLLVNFAAGEGEEGGSFAEYFVAWADILAIHDVQPDKYAESIAAGRQAIHADMFESWSAEHGYSEPQIFVNLLPIIAAACTSCTGALADFIHPQSVESEAFLGIFTHVEKANFAEQSYNEIPSAALWPK